MLARAVEFDESDLFTLGAALDMLKQECQSHMETTPGVPQKARLSSIERIEKKLEALTKQPSANAFAASFEIKRKAQSEFFTSRPTEHGELPWLEIRSLRLRSGSRKNQNCSSSVFITRRDLTCRLFTASSRLAGMIRMGVLNLAHCRRGGQEQIRQCKLATTYLATSIV